MVIIVEETKRLNQIAKYEINRLRQELRQSVDREKNVRAIAEKSLREIDKLIQEHMDLKSWIKLIWKSKSKNELYKNRRSFSKGK